MLNKRKRYTEQDFAKLGYSQVTFRNQLPYQFFFMKENDILICKRIPIIGLYSADNTQDKYKIVN
jgi:hypothetical protein